MSDAVKLNRIKGQASSIEAQLVSMSRNLDESGEQSISMIVAQCVTEIMMVREYLSAKVAADAVTNQSLMEYPEAQ